VMATPKAIDYDAGLRLASRLLSVGRVRDAQRWADQLCRHRPDDPRAHNQAGLARQRANRPSKAVSHFRRALLLQPDAAEVWANLGNALRHAAAFDASFRCRRFTVFCQPDLPGARMALGHSLLAAGDYRAGFAEHEHRPHRLEALGRYAALGVAAWDGRTLDRKRLLVVAEQGAGDIVQFLRFVRPLADRGVAVTVACGEPMERLVRSTPGVAATAPKWPEESPTGYDGVELLMSLPARLGVDLDNLPAPARYLEPPPPRRRLAEDGDLRVGLCWSGSVRTPLNEFRRIPFDHLAPVLEVPGAQFYGLQILVDRYAIAGEPRLIDLGPDIEDFADTAAMVDQMDLVITVDTSIAHIAGALGRPVWTLLGRVADWRWGYGDEGTPWYPRMRLYRQVRAGDWSDVVARVVADLRGLADAGPRRPFASPNPSR